MAHGRDGYRVVMPQRQSSRPRQAIHEQLTLGITNIEAMGLLQRQRNTPWIRPGIRFTGRLALKIRVGVQFTRCLLAKLFQREGCAG
ncbi:hypothetical protein D3C84_941280 [compost metagenome]